MYELSLLHTRFLCKCVVSENFNNVYCCSINLVWILDVGKGKDKLHPRIGCKGYTLSLTLAVDGGRWVMSWLSHSTPKEETQYSLYSSVLGPLGPVWTVAENLAPIGIHSPDHPACNMLLHLLHNARPFLDTGLLSFIECAKSHDSCIIKRLFS